MSPISGRPGLIFSSTASGLIQSLLTAAYVLLGTGTTHLPLVLLAAVFAAAACMPSRAVVPSTEGHHQHPGASLIGGRPGLTLLHAEARAGRRPAREEVQRPP